MKKIFTAILVVLVSVAFTACNGSDYKKAVKLMDSKNYTDAKALFSKLGSYKDSAELAKQCDYNIAKDNYSKSNYSEARDIFNELGDYSDSAELSRDAMWEMLFDFYYSDGSTPLDEWLKNSDYSTSISGMMSNLYVDTNDDRNGLDLMYTQYFTSNDGSSSVTMIKAKIHKNKPNIEIEASLRSNEFTYSSKTSIEKNNFTAESNFSWGTIEVTPYMSNMPSSINDSVKKLLSMSTESMFEYFDKTLKKDALGVTMADVGFTSYSK